MWNKVKTIIITVLATLGVLFIILMLIPNDEDSSEPATQEVQVAQEAQESQYQDDTEETSPADQNTGTVTVDIPATEISDKKLKFKTVTLDGKKVDQDIFSDYDITVVHVWGTYCGPCIAEMGEYAQFYQNAPENVNLIGIVCDVYDGIDNNVDDAKSILSENGAGFTNLRTSDSVYEITQDIQLIPSSFFVDRQGHIIGEIMQGRHYEETVSRLNGYLR